MKPIKIAILSCNHGHARGYYALKNDPYFELVGVSIKPGYEGNVGLENHPEIKQYGSDDELYAANPDLEAVIIASDNQSHISQVREAAKRGFHIFSMKIPTLDTDEYREMIDICEKAGVVCQVELEMRYHAELYRVKELIAEEKIGKLLAVNMVNYSHNPVWWRPWQCNPEASYGKRVRLRDGDDRFRGGALTDHPHVFDAVRFITDSEFDSVYADVAPNPRDGVETEDMIRVIGKLKNGVNFSIDPSYANDEHHVPVMVDWRKYPQSVEVFATFVGTKGVILADLYDKRYYEQSDPNGEYKCYGANSSVPWNRLTNEFYFAIREGKKPLVTLCDHHGTILAMDAAYRSITERKVIKL